MSKFYFFKSSYPKDGINCMSVFTNSLKKAYSFAFKQFAKHDCKGVPTITTVQYN